MEIICIFNMLCVIMVYKVCLLWQLKPLVLNGVFFFCTFCIMVLHICN